MKSFKKFFYKWLLRNIGGRLPDPSEWNGRFKFCHRLRNRWARKIAPSISKEANICRGARIGGDGLHLVLEPHSAIGINCTVGSDLFIGEHTMMGPNCNIITSNHARTDGAISTDVPPVRTQVRSFVGYEVKPVYIGCHSWIGRNVIILPGAKIGNHCTVGAGSVVPGKEYPDYSLIVGNPAVVKKIYR